jgi:Zn-dependent protease with chaperone function
MAKMDREADKKFARQGRTAALVIAGAMLIWLAAQWIGPKFGLAGRYAILVDLLVLAAFFWALVVSFQMWRKRHADKG